MEERVKTAIYFLKEVIKNHEEELRHHDELVYTDYAVAIMAELQLSRKLLKMLEEGS